MFNSSPPNFETPSPQTGPQPTRHVIERLIKYLIMRLTPGALTLSPEESIQVLTRRVWRLADRVDQSIVPPAG